MVPVHHYAHNNGTSVPIPDMFFASSNRIRSKSAVYKDQNNRKLRFKLYYVKTGLHPVTAIRYGEIVVLRVARYSDHLINMRAEDKQMASRIVRRCVSKRWAYI